METLYLYVSVDSFASNLPWMFNCEALHSVLFQSHSSALCTLLALHHTWDSSVVMKLRPRSSILSMSASELRPKEPLAHLHYSHWSSH